MDLFIAVNFIKVLGTQIWVKMQMPKPPIVINQSIDESER